MELGLSSGQHGRKRRELLRSQIKLQGILYALKHRKRGKKMGKNVITAQKGPYVINPKRLRAERRKNEPTPYRKILKSTWNKVWTKNWLLANTSFNIPPTLVCSATWAELRAWLAGTSCPTERWVIVKPVNLSRSRGVRMVWKEPNDIGFRDANLRLLDSNELFLDIVSDIPKAPTALKWIVEEYISPAPEELKTLEYDAPFNPLVRIIMSRGDFHFGEIHIPTKASRGRGTLQGGARRICFNYAGELLQTRPDVPNDLPWSIENYGTVKDVTGMVLPFFDKILDSIKNEICLAMSPHALFAFDGVYRQNKDGSVDFVCIEIEHAPNVKHLNTYDGLRRPCE
jgi:hypothetical protein